MLRKNFIPLATIFSLFLSLLEKDLKTLHESFIEAYQANESLDISIYEKNFYIKN